MTLTNFKWFLHVGSFDMLDQPDIATHHLHQQFAEIIDKNTFVNNLTTFWHWLTVSDKTRAISARRSLPNLLLIFQSNLTKTYSSNYWNFFNFCSIFSLIISCLFSIMHTKLDEEHDDDHDDHDEGKYSSSQVFLSSYHFILILCNFRIN